jgi:uncharacterized protein YjbJ (UPF0337 family)
MTRNVLALGAALLAAATLVAGCGDPHDGAAQKTTGHIERAAGSLTGDDQLKHQGQKDEVVGGVKNTMHDAKDAMKDATK